MASNQDFEIPSAGKWKDLLVLKDGEEVIPEPVGSEQERKIWTTQLMFPFSLKKENYAFCGPYPPRTEILSNEVNGLFPKYVTCGPRIFEVEPYNFGYLKNPLKVFRAAPYTAHKDYIPWLDRVEKDFKGFWENYGIYPLIQFSRTGPKYKPELLVAALHFYEKSTNTFQFKCGMLTPTLLDVAAITGLRPTGDHFDPTKTGDKIELTYRENTFSKYIAENMGKEGEEVSHEEHVAFLTLWLSHFVFCSKSLQVARMFIPMAQQIHEGRIFSLGRLLLATLYEAMGNASDAIKASKDGSTVGISGPMWLLQLWLNATFETELGLIVPSDYQKEVDEREIEGQRLVRLAPRSLDQDTRRLFMRHMKMFLTFDKFLPRHAPFVERKYGAAWFIEEFPAFNPDDEEEVNEVWRAYLEQTVLSCRIGDKSNQFGLVGYQPNCVARQFGMSQIRPKSLFETPDRMVLGTGITEKIYKKYMRMIANYEYTFKPFEFKPSFYCTDGFSAWWNEYYSRFSVGSAEHVLGMVDSGFIMPSLTKKAGASGRGKAIKKDAGSSKTSTEVQKPAGSNIKAEVETSKPKSRKRHAGAETASTASKRSRQTVEINTEDDEEEEAIPFERKRKQPAVSTSHGGERENTTDDASEEKREEPESNEDREIPLAKKKKDKAGLKIQGNPSKDQGKKDEKKKKKKNEGKRPEVTVREKSAIKKTKVHKAPKIHTSSDSGEAPKPTETPAQEKEILVEDQNAANKGMQDNVQQDGTTLMQDTPNVGQHDSLADPEVRDTEDKSKEDTPQEHNQQSPQEVPNEDKTDADKVEPGNFNGGPKDGEGPNMGADGDSIKVLPTNSSTHYTIPSTSSKSGQASSTQESQHDSEYMPEAEAGGPDLASVSSTSMLSASLGVQEEEFANMHKSDPAGTLRLLLSKKQSQTATSSERTTSDSAPSTADINSQVRQDSLLLRLTTDFMQRDVLAQLEANPACAYSHLAFLKKFHNPLTDEITLGKVIQLGSIIDQFAKAVQKRNDNDTRLATQQQAQAMFFERAQKAQAEVDRLSLQLKGGNPGVESCDKNIAHYKQQIKVLEEQIVSYRRKIIEEETEKARLEREAKAATQEQIDAYGREGIQAFSSAEVIAEEITALESSKLVVDKELTTLKKIYAECTKNL